MSDMFMEALTVTGPTLAEKQAMEHAAKKIAAANARRAQWAAEGVYDDPTRASRDPVAAEARAAIAPDATQCAIELLTAQGYRITKPRTAKAKCAVPALNAVGKPFGAQYDPKYRMKYHPRRYAYP